VQQLRRRCLLDGLDANHRQSIQPRKRWYHLPLAAESALLFVSVSVKRWALCVRIALAVVAVANLVGLAGNIAGAAVYARATKLCETASLNFADNSTIDGSNNCVLANHEVQLANFTVSVQALCEAAVLLLIVAGFTVVAFVCARRINAFTCVSTGVASPEQIVAILFVVASSR